MFVFLINVIQYLLVGSIGGGNYIYFKVNCLGRVAESSSNRLDYEAELETVTINLSFITNPGGG